MNLVKKISKFGKFYLASKTKYKAHSPFLFEFFEEVLEDERKYYAFSDLELLRDRLKKDNRSIQVSDFGAGSQMNNGKERKVSEIAKSALSRPGFCQLLFRLVKWRQPKRILEMGSSLGISGSYMKMACRSAKMVSMEGCPNIAAIAQSIFAQNKLDIQMAIGPFAQHLDHALSALKPIDFVFVDGHHKKNSTLAYWERLQENLADDALIVFDDIYWTDEMEEAWKIIKQTEGVALSIDLFEMGIIKFERNSKTVPTHHKIFGRKVFDF